MIFARLHKRVTYGLVIAGLLPISLSGEIPLLVLAAVWVAILVSYAREIPRERSDVKRRSLAAAVVATLVVCAALGAASGNWLLYAIIFALVMIVTRLYLSRSSRDVFQLMGLSFMALIVGAVVNPDILFLFVFVVYVVLLIWGLVLIHLQRDMESLAAEAEGDTDESATWQSTTLLGPGFLAGTSVLALLVLLFSVAFFFLFPRMGMGFFFGQGRDGKEVSGFSEQMDLGHFGTIKDDMDVVLRVAFPQDPANRSRKVRMRGISLDHYDGKRWSKTDKHIRGLPTFPGGMWAVLHNGLKGSWEFPDRWPKLVQDIYLEPLNTERRVIFGQPRMIHLSISNSMLNRLKRDRVNFYQDHATDVATRGRGDTAIRYQVASAVIRPTLAELRAQEGDVPTAIAKPYLQLPDDLSPRIRELAKGVTADAATPHDKVLAVMRWLRSNTRYSLVGGHDPSDPLSDFLFRRKEGHCEYYSTAMAVLLRAAGVAARPANGFFGGAYNPYGQYYAIRQADAHSWVEVWYPEFGWLTYDPTPPSFVLVPRSDTFWSRVAAYIDSLKLKWYRWVVEYDLAKQLEVFKGIGSALKVLPEPDGQTADPKAWKRGVKKWANDPTTWWIFASPLLWIIGWRTRFGWRIVRWFLRRRRRTTQERGGRVAELYRQTLVRLEKRGLGRGLAETPRAFAERCAREGAGGSAELWILTEAFEAAVYGGVVATDSTFRELTEASASVQTSPHFKSAGEEAM